MYDMALGALTEVLRLRHWSVGVCGFLKCRDGRVRSVLENSSPTALEGRAKNVMGDRDFVHWAAGGMTEFLLIDCAAGFGCTFEESGWE